MRSAKNACVRSSSSTVNTQLAPAFELTDRNRSSSNPVIRTRCAAEGRPMRSSTSRTGTPSHAAALSRPKFAGSTLPEHSMTCVPIGPLSVSSVRNSRLRSCGRSPPQLMRQFSGWRKRRRMRGADVEVVGRRERPLAIERGEIGELPRVEAGSEQRVQRRRRASIEPAERHGPDKASACDRLNGHGIEPSLHREGRACAGHDFRELTAIAASRLRS